MTIQEAYLSQATTNSGFRRKSWTLGCYLTVGAYNENFYLNGSEDGGWTELDPYIIDSFDLIGDDWDVVTPI